MMAPHRKPALWFAAALLQLLQLLLLLLLPLWSGSAHGQPERLNTIKDVFAKLHSCWTPPPRSRANPIDITVVVSFNREGAILGRPKITHESEQASDNDRLIYRVAVMEALQRCTPLPFTEALGGAIAGRPLAIPFSTRKKPPLKPTEQRAWLTPKIL